MADTINININDKTSDGRFSGTNTATDVAKTATKTTTEPATTTGSTPSPEFNPTPIQPGLTQKVTGALGNKLNESAMGMASKFATPAVIATTALAFAKYAYNRVNEISNQLNQMDDLRLRAGGSTRGTVNQARGVNIFGRYTNGQGRYIRR